MRVPIKHVIALINKSAHVCERTHIAFRLAVPCLIPHLNATCELLDAAVCQGAGQADLTSCTRILKI